MPIRLRVTLAFSAAMALVLLAAGVFLHSQLASRLDESIDSGLRSRAGELAALVRAADGGLSDPGRSSLIEAEESFAQVLTPTGRIVDATAQLRGRRVLTRAELERASRSATLLERERVTGIEGRARLLATPVAGRGGERVAVVGSSLQDRDEALASLSALLLVGGPVALLLASLAGYAPASAALAPVEAMRRRAAAISARGPSERLPVPPARDELGRLGETLNAMLGRLEATLERERRFVDDASHELRTPLALHKAELELALAYASSEQELRAAISSAVEEIDRLIRLAEDLLLVARSDEGELAVTLRPLPVSELLGSVGERFRARAAQEERPLRVEDGDGLVVAADRMAAEQALTGMVDNALRHGDGEVRLWARAAGERVELHVSDRGPGFPPEFVARAFERFSRAGAARAGDGGAGLGLAIVSTIARAHRGAAGAANDPRGGADVWIALPAASS